LDLDHTSALVKNMKNVDKLNNIKFINIMKVKVIKFYLEKVKKNY